MAELSIDHAAKRRLDTVCTKWLAALGQDRLILPEDQSLAPQAMSAELLSNLVFETCRSCGDLVWGCGFNSVFEPDAGDDFGEVVKAA